MAVVVSSERRPSNPSSFSSSSSSSNIQHEHRQGIKRGPNGAAFVSSGVPDLDKILGGGFLLGTIVMVMEDVDAPHHLLLLRNFMSQGIVHRQPLLFGSPLKEPRAFLGTLPAPSSPSSSSLTKEEKLEDKGLRIAWQYKKYFGEQPATASLSKGIKQEFSNDFDLRKPLDRHMLGAQDIDTVAIQNLPNLKVLCDHCSNFLTKVPQNDGSNAGRIAIQSLCAPHCGYTNMDWDMISFIRSLRAMIRSSNAVALITFPTSLLPQSFSKRWQHLADTLLSVRAVPDEDNDLAKLLTGYQDMVGFLHVHKVAQINSQVPVILEATTFSLKLHRRRSLVLERLNQAPVDGSSGTSYATTGSSCSKGSSIDF